MIWNEIKRNGKKVSEYNGNSWKEKNSANIELHFWIIHEIFSLRLTLFSPLVRSRWVEKRSVRAENQWNFFRLLCYIRKKSLPKEKVVLAKKKFLIRPHSLSFSPLTHPFSLWSFSFFRRSIKISSNREEKKEIVERKTKDFFSVAHSTLENGNLCRKKWTQRRKKFVATWNW